MLISAPSCLSKIFLICHCQLASWVLISRAQSAPSECSVGSMQMDNIVSQFPSKFEKTYFWKVWFTEDYLGKKTACLYHTERIWKRWTGVVQQNEIAPRVGKWRIASMLCPIYVLTMPHVAPETRQTLFFLPVTQARRLMGCFSCVAQVNVACLGCPSSHVTGKYSGWK